MRRRLIDSSPVRAGQPVAAGAAIPPQGTHDAGAPPSPIMRHKSYHRKIDAPERRS
jgi:hypothetical protein